MEETQTPPQTLAATLAEARRQHPGVCVEPARFGAYLAARPGGAAHAADLYLACACADGDAAAIARFEALCIPAARAAIARVDASPAVVEELVQDLRDRLLCSDPPGSPPRVAGYGGRGPLTGWVRAAALRLALNRRRDRARAPLVSSDEALGQAAAETGDPELGLIRAHYRDDFRAAFQAALAALSSRDRTLLRLHLLDGLTAEQIGAMHRAHRVTVARWLGQARRQLLDDTRRRFAERLGLPGAEIESLTGLVPSRLDLSLSRLLRAR